MSLEMFSLNLKHDVSYSSLTANNFCEFATSLTDVDD